MVGEGNLQVVVVTTFLVRGSFLGILGPLVLFVDGLLHLAHLAVWQRTHTENAERVASLVDLSDSHVLDDARDRSLHDILKGVSNSLEHVGVDESP